MQTVKELSQKRISRRKLLIGIGTGLAGAALAACAPKAEPGVETEGQVPAPEQVEITMLSHIYEPWNNALSAAAMQYMGAHENVKIVYSYIPHADLNTKIVTALASGDAPTIMGVYGPWMPQLISGKHLSSASDLIIADLDENFPPVMKEAATYDGKVYGYVQHIGIPIPIINQDLYAADGVQPPTSYEELAMVNAKLDKKDGDEWQQFGTTLSTSKGGSWNVIHFSAILFSFGGQYLSDDLSKAVFNSDEGLAAAETYLTLAHPEAPGDSFVLGKSAMEWNGPWSKSNYAATAPNLKYKAIQPLKGPKAQVTGSYVWFWVVSGAATPAQQTAAWDYNKWLSAPEQYAAMYRNVGLLPITKTLPEELATDEWAQAFSQALNNAQIYYSKHKDWEKIDVAIGEEIERFAAKEISAKDFLTTAESKVNAILKG